MYRNNIKRGEWNTYAVDKDNTRHDQIRWTAQRGWETRVLRIDGDEPAVSIGDEEGEALYLRATRLRF